MDAEKTFSKLRNLLKERGFVILSFVDVQEIMKSAFSEKFNPYFILEVCNPAAARELIGLDHDFGLLLPCKVVLDQQGSETTVSMLRVSEMAGVTMGTHASEPVKYEDEIISAIDAL
ncbi:MAG: DUF302 domain-containing protein [Candidatus Thermoplasmatota archaeon]|nr:DUF302 domain-containing protein [Candidatus Thermoplasmatota archaeon]MCL5793341.1 DUF302 domain-containing protein [Candidatus Thermoplasmatota archaeon]